jgi:tetratricopeptide (TPR) repeat protein
VQAQPKNAQLKSFLSLMHSMRARRSHVELGRYEEALLDWDQAVKLDKAKAWSQMRLGRALTLAYLGQHERALKEAKAAAGHGNPSVDTLYNLACVHAVASAAVRKGARLPLADREKRGKQLGARAVALLTEI